MLHPFSSHSGSLRYAIIVDVSSCLILDPWDMLSLLMFLLVSSLILELCYHCWCSFLSHPWSLRYAIIVGVPSGFILDPWDMLSLLVFLLVSSLIIEICYHCWCPFLSHPWSLRYVIVDDAPSCLILDPWDMLLLMMPFLISSFRYLSWSPHVINLNLFLFFLCFTTINWILILMVYVNFKVFTGEIAIS